MKIRHCEYLSTEFVVCTPLCYYMWEKDGVLTVTRTDIYLPRRMSDLLSSIEVKDSESWELDSRKHV